MNVSTSDWLDQVISEARAGRESAYRLLHHRYAARIFGYLYYVLDGTEREATLAIPLVLSETVQASDTPVGRGVSFGTRAHRAAYQLVLRKPTPAAVGTREQPGDAPEQPALRPPQAPMEWDCQTFRAALRHLPQDERHVIVLRLVQRLSDADTAWVMDRPREDILRLQAGALMKLKLLLQSWGSHGPN